jgi:hypothetical protein
MPDDAIPGASLQKNLSTLGNLSMAYTVPCNADFSFGLVIGSQTFVLSPSNLIVPMGDGNCVSTIEAWTNPWQTNYAFGSRFMSTVYMYVSAPEP